MKIKKINAIINLTITEKITITGNFPIYTHKYYISTYKKYIKFMYYLISIYWLIYTK